MLLRVIGSYMPNIAMPISAAITIYNPFTQYVHEHATENIVQVGFSYQFNLLSPPAPVIAKY